MTYPTPYEPTDTDKLQAEELRSDLFHEVGGWAWHAVVYGLFGAVLAHASGAPWPLCVAVALFTGGAWLMVTTTNAYLKAARKAARVSADEAEAAKQKAAHVEALLNASLANVSETQAAIIKALEQHAGILRQHGQILGQLTGAVEQEAVQRNGPPPAPSNVRPFRVLKGADAEALRPEGVEGDLVAAVELPAEDDAE